MYNFRISRIIFIPSLLFDLSCFPFIQGWIFRQWKVWWVSIFSEKLLFSNHVMHLGPILNGIKCEFLQFMHIREAGKGCSNEKPFLLLQKMTLVQLLLFWWKFVAWPSEISEWEIQVTATKWFSAPPRLYVWYLTNDRSESGRLESGRSVHRWPIKRLPLLSWLHLMALWCLQPLFD